jgi:hypothetical protein
MKFIVAVTQIVEVELDESKFTNDWLADYCEHFYITTRNVEDHAMHIAQLHARGLLDPHFTEGYGRLADMGIKARITEQDEEIIS